MPTRLLNNVVPKQQRCRINNLVSTTSYQQPYINIVTSTTNSPIEYSFKINVPINQSTPPQAWELTTVYEEQRTLIEKVT